MDGLDAIVRSQPEEAFASVGVFGLCGREEYLAESRAVLVEKIVKRLRVAVHGSV